MHKYLSTLCQCELSVSFSSFFSRDVLASEPLANHLLYMCMAHWSQLIIAPISSADKHKVTQGLHCLIVWNMWSDTSSLCSEHEIILLMGCQLRTPKFDFVPQNESENLKQFIMLFVTRLTRYPLQFISYLGVVLAIFLHFSVPPSPSFTRCWLNSCLQPWCWNITENCFIMLKLVNKERPRTSLNHRARQARDYRLHHLKSSRLQLISTGEPIPNEGHFSAIF